MKDVEDEVPDEVIEEGTVFEDNREQSLVKHQAVSQEC